MMNDLRKNIKLTVTNPGFFVKIAKGCERLLTSINLNFWICLNKIKKEIRKYEINVH